MSGELRPTGKPAQQLMEMLWAEEDKYAGLAPIYTHTSRLLLLGYVQRDREGLHVYLTHDGRNAARTLSATMEGQLYKASITDKALDPGSAG